MAEAGRTDTTLKENNNDSEKKVCDYDWCAVAMSLPITTEAGIILNCKSFSFETEYVICYFMHLENIIRLCNRRVLLALESFWALRATGK